MLVLSRPGYEATLVFQVEKFQEDAAKTRRSNIKFKVHGFLVAAAHPVEHDVPGPNLFPSQATMESS